jgi:hypothetical protein
MFLESKLKKRINNFILVGTIMSTTLMANASEFDKDSQKRLHKDIDPVIEMCAQNADLIREVLLISDKIKSHDIMRLQIKFLAMCESGSKTTYNNAGGMGEKYEDIHNDVLFILDELSSDLKKKSFQKIFNSIDPESKLELLRLAVTDEKIKDFLANNSSIEVNFVKLNEVFYNLKRIENSIADLLIMKNHLEDGVLMDTQTIIDIFTIIDNSNKNIQDALLQINSNN